MKGYLDTLIAKVKELYPGYKVIGGDEGTNHAEDYLKDEAPTLFDANTRVHSAINHDQGICDDCSFRGTEFNEEEIGSGLKFTLEEGIELFIAE